MGSFNNNTSNNNNVQMNQNISYSHWKYAVQTRLNPSQNQQQIQQQQHQQSHYNQHNNHHVHGLSRINHQNNVVTQLNVVGIGSNNNNQQLLPVGQQQQIQHQPLRSVTSESGVGFKKRVFFCFYTFFEISYFRGGWEML